MIKISSVLPKHSDNFVVKLLVNLFLVYNFHLLLSVLSIRVDELFRQYYTHNFVFDTRIMGIVILCISSSIYIVAKFLLQIKVHGMIKGLLYSSLVLLISDFHHGFFGDLLLKKSFDHSFFVFLQVVILGVVSIPLQYRILKTHVYFRRMKIMFLGNFMLGLVSFLITQIVCFHELFFYFSLHALPMIIVSLISLMLLYED